MSQHGRAWRGRTVAAIAVVGAFYGAASFALVSTDSAPVAPARSDAAAAREVTLVGATRSGQNPPQGFCRIPGWPFCPPPRTTTRTVTTTITRPVTSTVTSTVTQPVTSTATSTVTSTVTQPVTTVVTVTDAETTTTTTTERQTETVTDTRTVFKTVTVTG